MEVVGLLLGLTGPLRQIVDFARQLNDRHEAFNTNTREATALLRGYQHMISQLETIAQQCDGNIYQFPTNNSEIFKQSINELRETFASTIFELQNLLSRINSRLYRFTHALRSGAKLAKLSVDARRAQDLLIQINIVLSHADVVERVSSELRDTLLARFGDLEISTSYSRDSFSPNIVVPNNPPHVVLDYSSIKEGLPATFEGRLKAVVLQENPSAIIGAVATGQSGVGKSCAMRGLARLEEIKIRFPGGIYFVSLGKDATITKLVQQLCHVIEFAGGKQTASELRNETSLHTVVTRTKGWFGNNACLFMIDDVWRVNDINQGLLVQLSNLVDESNHSRLVYTTRDRTVALQGEIVSFEARQPLGLESVSMLFKAAGVGNNDVVGASVLQAVAGILRICAGIPAAITVAGCRVRFLMTMFQARPENAWVEYGTTIHNRLDELLASTADNDEPLLLNFLSALDFLDQHAGAKRPYSFRGMHRALCVLCKQEWISVQALARLWKLRSDAEAFDVVKAMVQAGVGDAEFRLFGVRSVPGLLLPDLALVAAQIEAEKLGEVGDWYIRSLGYSEVYCTYYDHRTNGRTTTVVDRYILQSVPEPQVRLQISTHLSLAGSWEPGKEKCVNWDQLCRERQIWECSQFTALLQEPAIHQ